MRKFKRIYLVGFRATGKTTFGKVLAEKLGLSFLDTDFLIIQEAGMEADKLTKNGTDWTKFRELENEVLEETSKMENVVISCGGGVGVNDILDPKTKKTFGNLNKEILLNSKGSLIILLASKKEVIEERLRRLYSNKRILPFLSQKKAKKLDPKSKNLIEDQIRDSLEALEKRERLYKEIADFEIDTSKPYFSKKPVKLNLVIGDPVSHSLSPQMHNAAYEALGIEGDNLFTSCLVHKKNLEKFVSAVSDLNINAFSVTAPHKEAIMNYLDEVDETSKKIGAVNTVVNENGKLIGYNTDWIGAINALEKKTDLKGKKVAVIGAGGAARAIIFGLVKKEAKVKIFNRTLKKAKELAKECRVEFGKDIEEIKNYDIIINATSVGMESNKSPIDKNFLNRNQIVFDIVYSPKETKLIKDAKKKGAVVIYGYEMLLYQGVEQFKLYTKYEAPVKEMEQVLIKKL